MGPDVSRLGVDSEDAPEAGAERRHGRSVAVEQEVVVLQPIREHVVRYDPPPALPHLIGSQGKDSGDVILSFAVTCLFVCLLLCVRVCVRLTVLRLPNIVNTCGKA